MRTYLWSECSIRPLTIIAVWPSKSKLQRRLRRLRACVGVVTGTHADDNALWCLCVINFEQTVAHRLRFVPLIGVKEECVLRKTMPFIGEFSAASRSRCASQPYYINITGHTVDKLWPLRAKCLDRRRFQAIYWGCACSDGESVYCWCLLLLSLQFKYKKKDFSMGDLFKRMYKRLRSDSLHWMLFFFKLQITKKKGLEVNVY